MVVLGLTALEVDWAIKGAAERLADIHTVKRVVESASGPLHDLHEGSRSVRIMRRVRSRCVNTSAACFNLMLKEFSARWMVWAWMVWVRSKRTAAVREVRAVVGFVMTTILGHSYTEHSGEDS